MKKMFFSAVALGMALTFGACGHGEKSQAETDTTLSSEAVDSMTQCYGEFMGAYINSNLSAAVKYDSIDVDKKEFLKGLQLVLSNDRSEDFVAGVNAGLQVITDLNRFKTNGAALNRAEVVRLIAQGVLGDTVSEEQMSKLQKQLSDHVDQLDSKMRRKSELAAESSAAGVANNNADQAYARNFEKSQPGAIRTKSGLVAAVETAGAGGIDLKQPLRANISVSHVNGKLINSQAGAVIMPDGQLPGISEALAMLGAGGKGTFVLPPALAYGALGMEQAGIGPMEWLVFDIEVIENIDPTRIAAAPVPEQ